MHTVNNAGHALQIVFPETKAAPYIGMSVAFLRASRCRTRTPTSGELRLQRDERQRPAQFHRKRILLAATWAEGVHGRSTRVAT
jgi:hypothetical protein